MLADLDEVSFSFAAGKGTALIIDIGQATASITPVVDGFVLRKGRYYIPSIHAVLRYFIGLAHSALPQLVHAHAKHLLTAGSPHRPPIELLCHQLIGNKKVRFVI